MDYINYVKQSPVQGLTGLWGGTQGALQQGADSGAVNFGNRGIGYGGEYPGNTGTVIDYFSIDTTANATNFGNCNADSSRTKGGGDKTRGLKCGGDPNNTSIEYITYASTGNGTDFGDMDGAARNYISCGSNGTRVLMMGGQPAQNTIEYVTIQTTGNGSNFGNYGSVYPSGARSAAGGGDETRIMHMGGAAPESPVDTIAYFTAMSTGNASQFGQLTQVASYTGSAYNDTRCWRMGGYTPTRTEQTDAVTIQTTGNATDWGDLVQTWRYNSGSSNGPRFVSIGGDDGQGMGQGETGYWNNTIQYFNADSTSNASNFGNLTQGRNGLAGMSGKG